MLAKYKHQTALFLCRLNFLFPTYLGFKYIKYRYFFLNKHYFKYNPERQLLKLVAQARANVAYYKNNIAADVTTLADFKSQVPFIDKDVVMEHWDTFQNKNSNKSKTISGTTGGTSGKPLHLVLPKDRYIFELGTMYKMWETVGWTGQIRAVLRNHKLNVGTTFKIDVLKREFIFDAFEINDSYFEKIYQTCKKYSVQFLHSYPSSAYQFALFLNKYNKDCSVFKAFFCGSEALLDEHKALFKKLNIAVFHWFGHSEKLVLGGFCKTQDTIHFEPTYGFVELISATNEPITTIGQVGEIVGTTLHNKHMPLFRYKTGDFAEYVGDYCTSCKRHVLVVKNVQGRWDKNKIFLSNGLYTTTTALNLHSDLYTKIEGLQYMQSEHGKLEIRIIKSADFDSNVENDFKNHFSHALGSGCAFTFKYVTALEREPNGKFLVLKQNYNQLA